MLLNTHTDTNMQLTINSFGHFSLIRLFPANSLTPVEIPHIIRFSRQVATLQTKLPTLKQAKKSKLFYFQQTCRRFSRSWFPPIAPYSYWYGYDQSLTRKWRCWNGFLCVSSIANRPYSVNSYNKLQLQINT